MKSLSVLALAVLCFGCGHAPAPVVEEHGYFMSSTGLVKMLTLEETFIASGVTSLAVSSISVGGPTVQVIERNVSNGATNYRVRTNLTLK